MKLPLWRRKQKAELDEELRGHLEAAIRERMERGESRADAEAAARREFGNVNVVRETTRDVWGWASLDALAQDVRYSFRQMRRSPGFAIVAIFSLAVGIGANTATFSLVNGVLLKPMPFRDPDRLFSVSTLRPARSGAGLNLVNPVQVRELAGQCPSLEQVALMRNQRGDLASGGEPASVPGLDVPHNLFTLFGAEPILGRAFYADEEQEGRNRVVILSESIWRARFNADPSLVGKTIVIDRTPHEVVGIVPVWFRVPFGVGSATTVPFDIFRPLALSRAELERRTGNYNYLAMARLKPGATMTQALAEMDVVLARFKDERTELKAALIPLHELVTANSRLGLWTLAAAVGAVLLIVCLNLANLLLARISTRARETAIRTALGASRGRQFRQALTESLLLAGCGGALGVLLADWAVRLFVASTTVAIPRLEEVRVDWQVSAFAFCITLITGLVFGALPAWRLTRSDPQEALRSGSHTATEGRRGLRLREGLISVEVGLSVALLIVAGLLTTSLTRLLQVDKGFDAQRVLTVEFSLSGRLYAEPASRDQFFERLLARAQNIPGVQAAGFVTALPTRGETWQDPIYLEGAPVEQQHTVNNRYASPGYFGAMNIAILRGRDFEQSDRGRGVAVLSEKAAKLLWPQDANPVGRTFVGEDNLPKTLVGIIGEVRAVLQREAPPTAYYPQWQRPPGGGTLVVRTVAEPQMAANAIRNALRSEDPQVPVRAMRTMEDVIGISLAQRRFQWTLMTAFAASALLIASLGIYGVVSYSVVRRRSEIGIRMALGAQRPQVLGLVLRQGMTPVMIGLALGVAAAFSLGGAVRGLLFGVEPTDLRTTGGVVAALLAVGLLACLAPARRACRVDPMTALRY